MTPRETALRRIKTIHTIAWAFFAGCILAIPVMAWRRSHLTVLVLVAIVLLECLVLVANRWRCPLTSVAAQYTEDRQDNFDIYLPLWLARYNKQIFGGLFLAGLVFAFARWRGWV
jgi:hypothetical protein